MRWNINNEVNNVKSPCLSLMTLQVRQKYVTLFFSFFVYFFYLFVYKIVQFVQLQVFNYLLSIPPNTSLVSFPFRLDFALADGAGIFEGMSVLSGTIVFRNIVSLGFLIYSWSCLTINFSFVGIIWWRFLIIKLSFSFKTL